MRDLLILFFLLLLEGTCLAQNSLIRQPEDETHPQLIEFWSSDNKLISKLDVKENSIYSSLPYKVAGNSRNSRVYSLDGVRKETLLTSFFNSRRLTADVITALQPSSLQTSNEISIKNNYAMIANHLNMVGDDGSPIGVKSTLSILNSKGEQVARMRENNDGYYSPVITKDGKYLAVNFGDVNPEGAYSLVPSPGFRIYDVTTGEKITEISSPQKFNTYPPMAFEDMIIEILQYPGDKYEYLFFDFSKRIVYSKIFTDEEVNRLKRFSNSSMIFLHKDGGEYEEKFETAFQKKIF